MDEHSPGRLGTAAGVAAYTLWGAFPLVFHQLRDVAAGEVLIHRVVWSFVIVAFPLAARRDRRWLDQLRSRPGAVARLAAAGALIAVNWLVYIVAVDHGEVTQAALGYYVTPLLSVGLGVAVLGERLRRLQVVALGFGAASVVVLTAAYGRVPWIALTLAASFGAYGFLKKAVAAPSNVALAVETAAILPAALVAMAAFHATGEAAFTNTSPGRDLLLVSLGAVTAAPLLLFGVAVTRIPLSTMGLLQYLTPTLQLLLGVWAFGEPLPPERLAGFVLVWVALGLLAADALAGARSRRPPPVRSLR